jgi:hypothetical protein
MEGRRVRNLTLRSADEGHELGASLVASSEGAQHGGGDGGCSGLLNTAHRHALMTERKTRSVVRTERRRRGREAHVASITTATPIGRIASSIAVAICFVRRS